ncbi:OmpA family protein [Egicoccus sp. AB-alg2]|uniref:OmpA family protein n=1 Tax=Egicoccus sp. AB-alg2 TaxID=3242693 RepID=UPI00359E78C5
MRVTGPRTTAAVAARRAAAAAAAALLLTACGGADAQDADIAGDGASVAVEDEDPDGADAEPEETERERPQSSVSSSSVDAPRSEAEIRVGEIIVEFDGELVDDGTLLTLEEPILFEFDSDRLKSSASPALDDIAEVLDFYGDAPVHVIGHTDDQGSAAYNQDLSQRRADAVTAALTSRGIDAGRVTSDGRGFDEPVASNDSDAGRAQNRRVEVLIVGVEPPDPE